MAEKIPQVQHNRHDQGSKKQTQRKYLHEFWINIYRQKSFHNVFNIGGGKVGFSHFFQHPVMPFREGAVPYPVKYTKYEPGTACQKQGDQVPTSCFPNYPSEKIKENEAGMEEYKKEIQ